MNKTSLKNIVVVSLALIGIMLVSTIIVLSFNHLNGFTTDLSNNDVNTSIALVAFCIAMLWRTRYK